MIISFLPGIVIFPSSMASKPFFFSKTCNSFFLQKNIRNHLYKNQTLITIFNYQNKKFNIPKYKDQTLHTGIPSERKSAICFATPHDCRGHRLDIFYCDSSNVNCVCVGGGKQCWTEREKDSKYLFCRQRRNITSVIKLHVML